MGLLDLFKKRRQYVKRSFFIDLEPGWIQVSGLDEGSPETYIKENDGYGAIGISTYPIPITSEPNGFDKIFIQYCHDKNLNKREFRSYQKDSYSYYELDKIKDNRYWKYLLVFSHNSLTFVTYNCDKKKKNEKEITEATIIMRSVTFSDKNGT